MTNDGPVGQTYNYLGDPISLREGYAVGVRSFPSLRAAFEAATPRHHVGYWVDGETGQAYYDLVKIADDEQHAREMGRRYQQIAVWSFRDNHEIRL
jgi:hypothetical protein